MPSRRVIRIPVEGLSFRSSGVVSLWAAVPPTPTLSEVAGSPESTIPSVPLISDSPDDPSLSAAETVLAAGFMPSAESMPIAVWIAAAMSSTVCTFSRSSGMSRVVVDPVSVSRART